MRSGPAPFSFPATTRTNWRPLKLPKATHCPGEYPTAVFTPPSALLALTQSDSAPCSLAHPLGSEPADSTARLPLPRRAPSRAASRPTASAGGRLPAAPASRAGATTEIVRQYTSHESSLPLGFESGSRSAARVAQSKDRVPVTRVILGRGASPSSAAPSSVSTRPCTAPVSLPLGRRPVELIPDASLAPRRQATAQRRRHVAGAVKTASLSRYRCKRATVL